MLFFLRNIRSKMIKENKIWNYFLYAIGEIFLVVIGIVIALEIGEWNQLKQDRKVEIAYLINLKRDLEQQIVEIDDHVLFEQDTKASTEYLLSQGIDVLVQQRADTLVSCLINLMIRSTMVGVDPTFEDLSATGNLRLITNQDLRRSLVIYYQSLEKLERIISLNNANYVDGLFNNGIVNNDLINFKEHFRVKELKIKTVGQNSKSSFNDLLTKQAFENLDDLPMQLKLTNLIKIRALVTPVHIERLGLIKSESQNLIDKINIEIGSL